MTDSWIEIGTDGPDKIYRCWVCRRMAVAKPPGRPSECACRQDEPEKKRRGKR